MTSTDADLLASFARHRDEASFRTLAERHFALIFHTALRRTGSRPLAEEITQNILCAVARKAAILAHKPGSFPAWLHRSTLFECTTAMRKEAVRQRHIQGLHADSSTTPLDSAVESARWQQALPHLDQALDRIPESDRQVLLLHFFESLPFPRIAALMGKSPAAVQKQSVRALEKLSRLLGPGKAALPVGLIASGLAAESVKAAPVILVPAFTAHALSTTTGVSGLSVMLATQQKILIPCSLLLLGTPLILQQQAIARAENELKTPPLALLATPAPAGKPVLPDPNVSSSLDLASLANEAQLAERSEFVDSRLRKKLRALETPQLVALLASTRETEIPRAKRKSIAWVLTDLISRRDPESALETALNTGWSVNDAGLTAVFNRYVEADLPKASKWLEHKRTEPEFRFPDLEYLTMASGPLTDLTGILLVRLAGSSESDARALFEGMHHIREREYVLSTRTFDWPQTKIAAETYLPLIRSMPLETKLALLKNLISVWASRDLSQGTFHSEILIQASPADEKKSIALMIGSERAFGSAIDQDQITRHIETLLNRALPEQAAEILTELTAQADRHAREILAQLRDGEPDDNTLYTQLLYWRSKPLAGEAIEQAGRILDPKRRDEVLNHLKQLTEKP